MSATQSQPAQPTAGGAASSSATTQWSRSSLTSASSSTAPWKSDSAEETVKTRRNALRVIMQKLRNFWPVDSETRLMERATLLEKGVYDVTNGKTDYIQRLQRDLALLSNRREIEKKHMRNQMQQAGDLFAQYTQEDKSAGVVAPNMTADAKAKFAQKIYAMEKKHSNKFILLKLPEDRLKHSQQEWQMRKLLERFKSQYSRRDKGPFDLKELNDIDHQLDRQQAIAQPPTISRMAPSRETADKQNDRTNQIGLRMADKMRKLNRERPLVIAELSWTIERDGPFTEPAPPPELAIALEEGKHTIPDSNSLSHLADTPQRKKSSPCPGAGQSEAVGANKRARHETGKPERSERLDVGGEIAAPNGQGIVRLGLHRSVGGAFVPSVRDGYLEAPMDLKSKGYTDADAPNDGDSGEQLPLAEHRHASQGTSTLPQTLHDAEQTIKLAALTISHPDFLAPSPLPDAVAAKNSSAEDRVVVAVGGGGGCVLRQRRKSLSLDGQMHQHEITIEVSQLHSAGQGGGAEVGSCQGWNSGRGWELAWDTKCASLRSLPVRMRVEPACGLDEGALLAGTAEMRRSSPASWLLEAVDGVARHLQCLELVAREVQQLVAAHQGSLTASMVTKKQGPGIAISFRCCSGGVVQVPWNVGMIISVLPGLGSAEGYPKIEPQWELTGLAGGLRSDQQFRRFLRHGLDQLPAPLTMTDLVEKMLDTCGRLMVADFGTLDLA